MSPATVKQDGRRLSEPWVCPEGCGFSSDWKPATVRHLHAHAGTAGQTLAQPWHCPMPDCDFQTKSPQGRANHQAAHRRRIKRPRSEAPAPKVPAARRNRVLEKTYTPLQDSPVLDHRFVPDELIGRDEEYEQLRAAFSATIAGRTSSAALVVGPPGAGKTALVRRFAYDVAEATEGRVRVLYVSCRPQRQMNGVLVQAIQLLDPGWPGRGFSPAEVLSAMERRGEARGEHYLLVLDDIETACLEDAGQLAFILSRTGSASEGRVSAILVDADFERDEFPEAGLQTIGESRIIDVQPLPRGDALVVVADRVEQAFGERRTGLSQEQLERVVDLVGGQPRFAIELVRVAAQVAEGRITDADIDKAAGMCRVTDSMRRRRALYDSEADVLEALFALPRGTHTTGDLERSYRDLMAARGKVPVEHSRFWQILNRLQRAGLLSKRLSGRGQAGTTQLIEVTT